MKKKTCPFLFFVSLALILSACSPAQDASPNPPKTPTAANVLFQDDFSNSESGWDQTIRVEGETLYDTEGYRIKVSKPNADLWANPGLNFVDTRIEVDISKVSGPDDNDMGIICRYQDAQNFYFLIYSAQGYFGIGKWKDGTSTMIGTPPNPASKLILPGDTRNHLRADCIGTSLTLYANGNKLLEVQDSDFASGDVGVLSGTFDQPNTNVLFDNFVVYKP